jgi:hypothetical protein
MSLDIDIPDEPLEYQHKTVSFPQISAEMVNSLALGTEDDLIVAARHGISMDAFMELSAQPWFQVAVATKRSEYEKTGVTFRAKAAWMAEELLSKVYLQAADNNASFNQTHEALKTMIKAGGLEPREERAVSTGPSFAINIDLGDRSVSISSNTIDMPLKELP